MSKLQVLSKCKIHTLRNIFYWNIKNKNHTYFLLELSKLAFKESLIYHQTTYKAQGVWTFVKEAAQEGTFLSRQGTGAGFGLRSHLRQVCSLWHHHWSSWEWRMDEWGTSWLQVPVYNHTGRQLQWLRRILSMSPLHVIKRFWIYPLKLIQVRKHLSPCSFVKFLSGFTNGDNGNKKLIKLN